MPVDIFDAPRSLIFNVSISATPDILFANVNQTLSIPPSDSGDDHNQALFQVCWTFVM